MLRPFAEIVKNVFPPSSRPEMPVTPARTAIWPPVGKVGLPASVSMIASVAALFRDVEAGNRVEDSLNLSSDITLI
jgi:hypothetical protein